ncbi:hypothetical protein DPMN_109950 [Dreissena polymorpha]|uniref:Uncharacterized protein n=1 Tax=Dreissena polymorpha TaxID=45954 RepID=A0A9D4QMI7_DREPO|nr:hypothetical protein DPMN_109950 [Dreissena polymorpha]
MSQRTYDDINLKDPSCFLEFKGAVQQIQRRIDAIRYFGKLRGLLIKLNNISSLDMSVDGRVVWAGGILLQDFRGQWFEPC